MDLEEAKLENRKLDALESIVRELEAIKAVLQRIADGQLEQPSK